MDDGSNSMTSCETETSVEEVQQHSDMVEDIKADDSDSLAVETEEVNIDHSEFMQIEPTEDEDKLSSDLIKAEPQELSEMEPLDPLVSLDEVNSMPSVEFQEVSSIQSVIKTEEVNSEGEGTNVIISEGLQQAVPQQFIILTQASETNEGIFSLRQNNLSINVKRFLLKLKHFYIKMC